MSQQQLTVFVESPNHQRNTGPCSRPWSTAIATLAKELKTQQVKEFIDLPVTLPGADAWIVRKRGVPYRCVQQYCLGPNLVSYIGRVDVGWIGA